MTPKILVVEDDEITQIVIRTLFKKFACQLDFAGSGEEGLEKYEKTLYNLLLIDIGLPGKIDGIQMIEMIRQSKIGAQLPLVALTAHMHKHQYERFKQAKANKLIIKPLTWPKLKSIIAEFLPESLVLIEQ